MVWELVVYGCLSVPVLIVAWRVRKLEDTRLTERRLLEYTLPLRRRLEVLEEELAELRTTIERIRPTIASDSPKVRRRAKGFSEWRDAEEGSINATEQQG